MNFAPTLSDEINGLVDLGLQRENAMQPPRDYLGGSEVGHECERRLAYSFHKEPREAFPGRPLRRFRMGHIHEAETVTWLQNAGFKIDHTQAGFSLAGGKFKGHIDGVAALGGPLDLPYPLLFEHKVMKAVIWRAYVKHGLRTEHATYFGQVQIYMRQFALKHTLFGALNTDTSELHFELIPYDSAFAESLIEKAARILVSKSAGEFTRIASVSTDFKCKWCPYREPCWAPPKVAAVKPSWMKR